MSKKTYYMEKALGEEICYLLVEVHNFFRKKYINCIARGDEARYCDLFEIGDKIKAFGKIQFSEHVERKGEKIVEEYLSIT